jgi:hypothetical protein
MGEDDVVLSNACTDLVSLKSLEVFPLKLLTTRAAGAWENVRELCQDVGVNPTILPPSFFVSWLPDPVCTDHYAVILFYDDETKWSTVAHYNRGRLMRAVEDHRPTPDQEPANDASAQSASCTRTSSAARSEGKRDPSAPADDGRPRGR